MNSIIPICLLGAMTGYFALVLFKKSHRVSGLIVMILALLISMFSVHTYHLEKSGVAGRKLAASFILVEELIEEGRLDDCIELLGQGIMMFTERNLMIEETADEFWNVAIAYSLDGNEMSDGAADQ